MRPTIILAALCAASLSTVSARAQDAAAGGALFRQRCQTCHTITPGQKGMLGPNLAGVVGRKAASTDFTYSPALKKSGLTWDKGTLDGFLTAPTRKVPGTRMMVSLSDAKQRADLISYLGTVKR